MKKYLSTVLLFFVFLFPIDSKDGEESVLHHHTPSTIGSYLDLTQSGVSEEYVEFLNIGSQKQIAEARSQGINPETGIDEAGEMMEGVLYVYGIQARENDLHRRIIILLFLILGIFLFKKNIR